MRRGIPAMVLALVSGALAPGAAAGGEPAVQLAVATDRFEFADTTLTASYAIRCAPGGRCPAARAARGIDVRRSEVRSARLGFAATRASVPVVPPEGPGATVQDESVTVDVARAGGLVVTLSGSKTAAVDAVPVAGTASSGGRVSGRSVRWSVASAKPGRYTFRARFRVVADPAAVGSYATQAVVERSATSATMLEHAWGGQPAGGRVRTVSSLTFRERVAPQYGKPRGHPHGWQVGRDADGYAEIFEGSASLDAYGAYSGATGAVGATSFLDLRSAVPGADVTSVGVSYFWWGAARFEPEVGYAYGGGDGVSRLSISLCALGPPASVPGSTVYDRDSGTVSAFADISTTTTERKGPPRNNRGRLRTTWSGRPLSGWASYRARSAPSPDEPLLDSSLSHGANINWEVTGGPRQPRRQPGDEGSACRRPRAPR